MRISSGDKIGIVCCSNGQKIEYKERLELLLNTLQELGLRPQLGDHIFETIDVFSGTAKERAKVLMDFYEDEEIKGIFDISGGDVANGILSYLDFHVIAEKSKYFWGYSDLTTVLNAIFTKTGKESVLYQIRNLIYGRKEQQIRDFKRSVLDGGNDLFSINYKFIQKRQMQGTVIGGNIRCFLKLAGTEYMPSFEDRILFLESCSGTVGKMETYLRQLQQLGAFNKAAGILLGTFTEMKEKNCEPNIEELVKSIAGEQIPIAVTEEIGHGTDSKAIIIGKYLNFGE